MSYDDPYLDPMYTGEEIDPYAMDQQQMIDFLVANGAGAGMVPDFQPSGRPLTVSNQTSALNAYRSGLFDTGFQGLGGEQAFAPGAFEPTVTQTIRQEPELQQVYSYLRSPTSMEGIITQELMLGGTPATAQRVLRQMLTATPEELGEIFTRYDQFFGREPSFNPAEAELFKTNLLLELPPAFQDGIQMEVEPDGTGVDWNSSEDGSVFAQAAGINELNAEIPRLGPSPAKWGTGPDGQPVQLSAGGELSWGFDESGAPVMIETTSTPSEAAQTFTDLGLPLPTDEYTAESFMSPDQIAMQQAYAATADPVAELKAAWMDPSLAPTNWQQQGPAAQLANGEPYVPGAGAPELDTTRYNFPTGLNEPGGAVVNAPGPGDVQTTAAQLLPHDPGAVAEFMRRVYPTLDRATQDALAGYLTDSGQSDLVPAQPPTVMTQGGQALAAPDILPQDPGAVDEWMRTVYPTLARGDQDAVDAYLATQQGGGGGWAGEGVNVDELMRRRAAGYGINDQPPGGALDDYLNNYSGPPAGLTPGSVLTQAGGAPAVPPPRLPVNYPAGDAATYEQFLAENPPLDQPARTPAYARPGAQPANQPGGPGFQPGATQADVDALLAQLLPGNQQRSTNLPAYTQPGAQPANQPGGAGFQPGATQATVDAMLAQILPGNQQQTMNQPPAHLMPGAQPANQPGGPQYMEAIETGERRAAQRQEDEQNAEVLGGTTDRTGRRVRPTRTGEQARQYRQAFEAWDQATDEQQRMKQATYTFETGQARAQAWRLQQQGIRPLDQAMMARRLVLMNAGMPQGI